MRIRFLIRLLCGCAFLARRVLAQSTALLTGTAINPSAAAVQGDQVNWPDTHTGKYSSLTNAEGLFRFPDLPIGTYEAR